MGFSGFQGIENVTETCSSHLAAEWLLKPLGSLKSKATVRV
jgi:hypothetical protein